MTRKTVYRKKVYNVLRGKPVVLNEDEKHALFCVKANLCDKTYRNSLLEV